MAKAKKKDLAEQQTDETITQPESLQAETLIPTAELAPATGVQANEVTDAKGQEVEDKKTPFPDPFGIHSVNIGGGRFLRFLRSNRYQQVGISFYSNSPDVDPKPTPEETEMLKEAGFERYRPDGKMRTMQLLAPEQKQEIAELEESKGERAATYLRSRLRSEGHQQAHEKFLELANEFRARQGMEPVGVGEERTPF